jgi:hypothetical protein
MPDEKLMNAPHVYNDWAKYNAALAVYLGKKGRHERAHARWNERLSSCTERSFRIILPVAAVIISAGLLSSLIAATWIALSDSVLIIIICGGGLGLPAFFVGQAIDKAPMSGTEVQRRIALFHAANPEPRFNELEPKYEPPKSNNGHTSGTITPDVEVEQSAG